MRQRKYARKRLPREVFLVICEGETEREYVEALKVNYRLPITVKTKVSGTTLCERLVNRYIDELGLDRNDRYKVFFVYDADVEHMVEKLKRLNGTLVLSNPCIELWFMLHVGEFGKSMGSKEMVKELLGSGKVWKSYVKGQLTDEQAKWLWQHKGEASQRARGLKWHDNPSSNMHVLIDAMEEAKTS